MTDPLVSAEVDLRDFAFMPLDVLRLRDSELAALPDAEAFRCAVLSWCVSWHQVPAASLPDDDVTLARLLGFGRDVKGWQKVRKAGGLRGWVQCSDGRLYHSVVATKAHEAWAAKVAQRARTEAARKAREEARQRSLQDMSQGLSQAPPSSVTDDVTASKGQGQGQGILKPQDRHLGLVPPAAAPPKSQGIRLPDDWRLPKAWGDWALTERPGWTAEDVRKVAERFADHWHAKAGADARKVDWQATWRNWVRREPGSVATKGDSRADFLTAITNVSPSAERDITHESLALG